MGDTHTARLVEDLKRTQIVQYAGASGDYNPLHTDEIFTTKVAGYPTRVRPRHADHGHDRQDADRLRRRRAADQVRRALHQPGVAGRHPGLHRDGEGGADDGLVELDVETKNQNGVVVVSGYAEARVDP